MAKPPNGQHECAAVSSALTEVEFVLCDMHQVVGAMRAVGNLARCWRVGDTEDLDVMKRDDLASLFEVLAGRLGSQLSTAGALVETAQQAKSTQRTRSA